MKSKNKQVTPNIEEAVTKSVNFEITVADIARRSERRAWWVAISAIFMSLILAGGYFLMLPLKEKVPYLVMADAYTGTSTVARLQDDFQNRTITASEAVNRSNVAHYVLARESYDYAIMGLRDWATVNTMSVDDVASSFKNLYTGNDSPYRLYGKGRAVRVKISSISLIGGGDGSIPKGATIRFQRTLFDKVSGGTTPLDNKIATMEFTYNNNLKMAEQYRIENPLGFQVTTYRVDNDFASPAPVEVPLQAAPPTAGQAATLPAGVDPSTLPPADSSNVVAPPATSQPAVVPAPQPSVPQQSVNGASTR